MQPSKNCYDLIESFEGLILHPYRDQAGIPTIGYGTTRYPNGSYVKMNDHPITKQDAEDFLVTDVEETADDINQMIPTGINQNQFDSLVSFAYNVGTGALHSSTLLRLIKENPNDPAITDVFCMWDKITVDGRHIVSEGLLNRRKKEAELYFLSVNSL